MVLAAISAAVPLMAFISLPIQGWLLLGLIDSPVPYATFILFALMLGLVKFTPEVLKLLGFDASKFEDDAEKEKVKNAPARI